MKSRYLKLCLPLSFFFWAFVTLASGSIDHLASSLSLKNPQVYSQKYITGGQPNQADFKKLADAGLEVEKVSFQLLMKKKL